MKKILILILLIASPAYADYQQGLKDYSYQFEQYRLAHQNYAVSKNKYLSYKTPVALAEALENGKKVISLRDMVLITYFQTLKERLNETKDLPPSDLVTQSSLIDETLLSLSSHKDKIQGTISLYDLTTVSKELESKENELNRLSKYVVSILLINKLQVLKDAIDKNQDFLNFTVSQNKAVLSSSVNYERWLIESKNKIILAGQKIEEAKAEFNSMDQTYQYSINDKFNKGQIALMSSNQYLKEALNFQKEVIRGITND